MKGMHGARRYTCDPCENVAMSSKEFERHMLSSHGSMSTRPNNLPTAGGWGRGVTFKVMEVQSKGEEDGEKEAEDVEKFPGEYFQPETV